MAPKKEVVIVGGGGAGADLARTLSGQLDSTKYGITLISAHPAYVYYVATLRMLVTDEGSLEDKVLIPYDKLFVNGNGTFTQGVVTAIETSKGSKAGGKILLEDGRSVVYDILALSPGSKWESFLDLPFEADKVKAHIQEWRDKFRKAKKVAIVGGGAVGSGEFPTDMNLLTSFLNQCHGFTELAGEIRHYYPVSRLPVLYSLLLHRPEIGH